MLFLALYGCAATQSSDPKAADGEETGPALSPAQIAERSTPAVVTVRTDVGLGTGFVIRNDGWIVTNLHVVAGQQDATVTFANQKELPVLEVLNASAAHDLILLRVDAKKLPSLALADSDRVKPGEPVVAIGHPLGLEDTVSNGLVSAVRKVDDLVVLQISAPIAPGSSGGPIFNERGEVIGVATAILAGGQNLNLGVPSNYVKELMKDTDPMAFRDFGRAVMVLQAEDAKVERAIPRHPTSIFKGCDDDAVVFIGDSMMQAISVGAALYNQGNHAACYHVYEGAALDIERKLPKSCGGPKRALSQGRARAARLSDASAQAWAMRDTFDGLGMAIAKRMGAKDEN